MKWINNYAWFGRKGVSYIAPFALGIIAEQNAPEYAIWLFIPIAVVFGWARKTRAADEVWFKGNRGPIEGDDDA
ncbi:hypothetical protein RVO06_00630 [Enterobacter hormaechei]|uniref:hypothetical protein n=1 Tax=Enterobacter hormaechei TaxID=158836 RepID=UPI0029292827|nr:hypothetical protein [Enterobacter hormaechei]MDV0327164.1 hypothetical protein [Enterobacter hormaechei]